MEEVIVQVQEELPPLFVLSMEIGEIGDHGEAAVVQDKRQELALVIIHLLSMEAAIVQVQREIQQIVQSMETGVLGVNGVLVQMDKRQEEENVIIQYLFMVVETVQDQQEKLEDVHAMGTGVSGVGGVPAILQ